MKKILALLLLTLSLSNLQADILYSEGPWHGQSLPENDCCYSPYQLCVIPSVHYRGGDGRGYEQGYEGGELFLGLYNKTNAYYPFIDVQINRVDVGRLATNVGIGWRSFSCGFEEMIGANVFYDYRRVDEEDFHQIGVGLELFARCWDLRANGYIPIIKRNALTGSEVFIFPGDYIEEDNSYERAMWGVDVELGRDIFCCRCVDIYAAVGPYFYSSFCCDSLVGGMFRLSAYCGKYLTLELYTTYDCVFDCKVQGEIALAIPFPCLIDCCLCLFRPLYRNDIILTERIHCWNTNF